MRIHATTKLGLALGALLAASVSFGASDLPEIQKGGNLRVLAVPFEGMPEFMVANRFDLELIEGFARLHRLEMELVTVPTYADLIPALNAGKGDVIACGLTVTEARRALVNFSVETFPSRMIVVTRKPHRVINTREELRTEKAGTEKGTSWAQATIDAGVPAKNIDDSIAMQDLPAALKSGRITAAVFEVHAAIPAARSDPELQLGTFLGGSGSLAWAVRKSDAALLTALNEYLQAARRTPTWHKLVVKYFGESAPDVLKRSRGN